MGRGWKVAPVDAVAATSTLKTRAGKKRYGENGELHGSDKDAFVNRLASQARRENEDENNSFEKKRKKQEEFGIEGVDKLFHAPETKSRFGFSHVRILVFFIFLLGTAAVGLYLVVFTSKTKSLLEKYDFLLLNVLLLLLLIFSHARE